MALSYPFGSLDARTQQFTEGDSPTHMPTTTTAPRRSGRPPGRPRLNLAAAPAADPSSPFPHHDQLADFAAKLRVGQACQGDCGGAATWAAVAPNQQRYGCDAEIGALLSHDFIWFLHPLP